MREVEGDCQGIVVTISEVIIWNRFCKPEEHSTLLCLEKEAFYPIQYIYYIRWMLGCLQKGSLYYSVQVGCREAVSSSFPLAESPGASLPIYCLVLVQFLEARKHTRKWNVILKTHLQKKTAKFARVHLYTNGLHIVYLRLWSKLSNKCNRNIFSD